MEEIRKKVCNKCGEEKYGFEFYILAKAWDGLSYSCVACLTRDRVEREKRDKLPKARDYPYV